MDSQTGTVTISKNDDKMIIYSNIQRIFSQNPFGKSFGIKENVPSHTAPKLDTGAHRGSGYPFSRCKLFKSKK